MAILFKDIDVDWDYTVDSSIPVESLTHSFVGTEFWESWLQWPFLDGNFGNKPHQMARFAIAANLGIL